MEDCKGIIWRFILVFSVLLLLLGGCDRLRETDYSADAYFVMRNGSIYHA